MDRVSKVLLVLVLVALTANLLAPSLLHRTSCAESEGAETQDLSFDAWRKGETSSALAITCSDDGKYVFATDGAYVYRSANYGKIGSWERVLR